MVAAPSRGLGASARQTLNRVGPVDHLLQSRVARGKKLDAVDLQHEGQRVEQSAPSGLGMGGGCGPLATARESVSPCVPGTARGGSGDSCPKGSGSAGVGWPICLPPTDKGCFNLALPHSAPPVRMIPEPHRFIRQRLRSHGIGSLSGAPSSWALSVWCLPPVRCHQQGMWLNLFSFLSDSLGLLAGFYYNHIVAMGSFNLTEVVNKNKKHCETLLKGRPERRRVHLMRAAEVAPGGG